MKNFDQIEIESNGMEPTRSARKSGSSGSSAPALLWIFFGLTILLAAGLGYLGYMTMELKKQLTETVETSRSLATTLETIQKARESGDNQLSEQTAELAVNDRKLSDRITEVGEEIPGVRAAIKQTEADLNRKIDALKEQMDLKESGLAEKINQNAQAVAKSRQDFEMEKSTFTNNLKQVGNDFEYIKEELGKKAEKSYLKFVKRDLLKQIEQVSSKVDEVKDELGGRIASTENKLNNMDSNLETRIEKKVDSATQLDFVPTEEDE